MRVTIFILAFLSSATLQAGEDFSNTGSIKKQFNFSKKLNGANQTIILNISAKSISAPVIWSIEVFYNGSSAYKIERNDEWLNSFFSDPAYIGNCTSYTACKEKWYFTRLPEMVNESLYIANLNPNEIESWQIQGLEKEAKQYFKQNGGLEKLASESIMQMKNQLKSGQFLILHLPFSPVQMESPKMYVQNINRFVTYASN